MKKMSFRLGIQLLFFMNFIAALPAKAMRISPVQAAAEGYSIMHLRACCDALLKKAKTTVERSCSKGKMFWSLNDIEAVGKWSAAVFHKTCEKNKVASADMPVFYKLYLQQFYMPFLSYLYGKDLIKKCIYYESCLVSEATYAVLDTNAAEKAPYDYESCCRIADQIRERYMRYEREDISPREVPFTAQAVEDLMYKLGYSSFLSGVLGTMHMSEDTVALEELLSIFTNRVVTPLMHVWLEKGWIYY